MHIPVQKQRHVPVHVPVERPIEVPVERPWGDLFLVWRIFLQKTIQKPGGIFLFGMFFVRKKTHPTPPNFVDFHYCFFLFR